ncbi:unannotated protein [freshwater metagenome]|uniref:Unannotated protein n=1 Tax=freshwater metagenome TaxID=449393 RepID=A0A6J5YYG0_9ZZZZ
MDKALIALPRYSRIYPCPPPVPIFAITAKIISLLVTPGFKVPSTLIAIVFGLINGNV